MDTPKIAMVPLPFEAEFKGIKGEPSAPTERDITVGEHAGSKIRSTSVASNIVMPDGTAVVRFDSTFAHVKGQQETLRSSSTIYHFADVSVDWWTDAKGVLSEQALSIGIGDSSHKQQFIMHHKDGKTKYYAVSYDADGNDKAREISRGDFVNAVNQYIGPYDQEWAGKLSKTLPASKAREELALGADFKAQGQLDIITDGKVTILQDHYTKKATAFRQKQVVPVPNEMLNVPFVPDSYHNTPMNTDAARPIATNRNLIETLPPVVLKQVADASARGVTVAVDERQPPTPAKPTVARLR